MELRLKVFRTWTQDSWPRLTLGLLINWSYYLGSKVQELAI